jgi:putative ABC transport system permease protein
MALPMSAGDFLEWQKQNRTFEHMSAITGGSFNVAEKGQPELIPG